MSGHTPGPWTAFMGSGKARAAVRSEAGHVAFCTMRGTGPVPPLGRPEMEANARLIRAAPELLEALKASAAEIELLRSAMFKVYAVASNGGDLIAAIEQMRDAMDKPWSVDNARAAIAKATQP